jgi:hypothetical protein
MHVGWFAAVGGVEEESVGPAAENGGHRCRILSLTCGSRQI